MTSLPAMFNTEINRFIATHSLRHALHYTYAKLSQDPTIKCNTVWGEAPSGDAFLRMYGHCHPWPGQIASLPRVYRAQRSTSHHCTPVPLSPRSKESNAIARRLNHNLALFGGLCHPHRIPALLGQLVVRAHTAHGTAKRIRSTRLEHRCKTSRAAQVVLWPKGSAASAQCLRASSYKPRLTCPPSG